MDSLKTLAANANKLANANDFEGALKLCKEGIETAAGGKFFPLVSMHGFCAMSLGRYQQAEKSFLAAKILEANPQMHQKNIKFLSDTYAELGKWREHAEESIILYRIAVEKGNIDRALSLSSQISSSFDKCQDFNAAGVFLVNHLKFLASFSAGIDEIPTAHTREVFTQLHSMKTATLSAHEDKKVAKKSIGSLEIVAEASVFDSDLLQDRSVYELLLLNLRQLAGEGRAGADEMLLAGPLLALLLGHVQSRRARVFAAPSADASSRVTYRHVFSLAHEALCASCSFFDPAGQPVQPATSSTLASTSFLLLCQVLVEAWFFVPEEVYEGISDAVERGQQVAATFSISDAVLAESTASFMMSAKVMHCITIGDKGSAVLLAKQVAPYWVASIHRHQNLVSSARRDTMKTPISSFHLTTAQLQESSEAVVASLCLCVAVALGALGGFRGDTFHDQLSLADALYLTQEVSTRVLCLKKILLALEHSDFEQEPDESSLSRGRLRQVILELVPLGRVRVLQQIKQVDAAVTVCRDLEWLQDVEEEDNHQHLAGSLRVNVDRVAALLPVSRWVFVRALAGGSCNNYTDLACGFREELVRVLDSFSTNIDDIFATLLQVEKQWVQFLIYLEDPHDRVTKAEFSFTKGLLRECMADEGVICSFVSTLRAAAAASSSSYFASYAAEVVEFRIGIAMWLGKQSLRADKSKCLAQLIKTAKLDPHFGQVYSFIGHYYLLVLNDAARAIKCYMKALAYDPMDAEAGISLSQIYIEAGEMLKVTKLWSDVNSLTVSHAHWCHSLSGQLKLCQQEFEESIQAFQRSLELWGHDLAAWHSLSVCYSSLGQSVAAFKSLQCVLALIANKKPEQRDQWEGMRVILVCELAEVERRMGKFQDSYDHFDEVRRLTAPGPSSAVSSHHVMALKGIGDVCLALGHERLTCGWSRGAYTIVTRGINAMDAVLGLLPSSSSVEEDGVEACLLKLKGDLCSFCRHFSPADQGGAGEGSVEGDGAPVVSVQKCSYDWVIGRAAEAETSYRKLLAVIQRQQLKQQEAVQSCTADDISHSIVTVWCDIGSALCFQAELELAARGQGAGLFSTNYLLSHQSSSESKSVAAQYLQKALEAFTQGLLLQPGHSGCWNGAGACCRLDESLREMCFVRATLPAPGEISLSAAYANLGSMFLAHNRQHCAKECLGALQLLEVSPLHWLVLGGLLEKSPPPASSEVNEKAAAAHQQSVLDAYTAALEVSKPVEGLLGIAVAFMRLHGFLTASGDLIWSSNSEWPLRVDLVALRYAVEQPIGSFLYRRPYHPFAWSLLAWSYVQRQAWGSAAMAYHSLLQVVERVLPRSGMSLRVPCGEEESYYVQNITALVRVAVQGQNLCRRMTPSFSSLPAPTAAEYPNIDQVFPNFESCQSTLQPTAENVVMKTFEENNVGLCCSQLHAARVDVLSDVQACHVSDSARLKRWVRWMQMIDFFVRHSSGKEREQFYGCLSPVGQLLTSSTEAGTDVVQKYFVLNAFRLYPEGFLQVGQALLHYPGLRSAAAAVLDLGLSLHPRNGAILRMFGRADERNLQSAAIASLDISRAMLTSSCTDENSVAVEILMKRSLCSELVEAPVEGRDERGAGCECVCAQLSVDHGNQVLSSFSDSVALHSAQQLQTGQRCSRRDRKDLLTALWMDPANLTTWAALAGSIFSDVSLGARSVAEEKSSKGESEETPDETTQATVVSMQSGVFCAGELVQTCVDILLYLRFSTGPEPGATSVTDDSFFVNASLFCDWGAASGAESSSNTLVGAAAGMQRILQLLSSARGVFLSGSYLESVPHYEQVIREMTALSDHSRSVLSKLLIELGNVYSFLILPEKACEQYKLSATVLTSAPLECSASSVSSFASLCCSVAFARRAATSQGTHADVTAARGHAEEAGELGSSWPSHAASAHVVKALIWLGLSKPNKVQQEVAEARAEFFSVEIPFC